MATKIKGPPIGKKGTRRVSCKGIQHRGVHKGSPLGGKEGAPKGPMDLCVDLTAKWAQGIHRIAPVMEYIKGGHLVHKEK